MERDELYARFREVGIYARRYFYPLISDFPMYRGLPSAAPALLPHARAAAQSVICLPIYPSLERHWVDRIVAIIRDPSLPADAV